MPSVSEMCAHEESQASGILLMQGDSSDADIHWAASTAHSVLRMTQGPDELYCQMPDYHIYIMSNRSKQLYVGMTNNLRRRVLEHKRKAVPGFTAKYNIDQLVYFETYPSAAEAIAREKKIKGWIRAKKLGLIEAMNPEWRDLASELDET